MIVRILEEGQYEVPGAELEALEALDAKLAAAIEADDAESYSEVLSQLAARVRTSGTPLDASTIVSSELTIPNEGTSLDEVKRLLASGDTVEV
ncbi:MAG: PspA-associated protein PspAA [Acidimicrobiales bacterium]